jgi:serine/threonine-protein kinase
MGSAEIRPDHRLKGKFLSIGRLVILGGVLITVFLLSAIIGMRLSVRSGETKTPALVGMSLEDAQTVIQNSDLKLLITGRRYNDEIPEESIISQIPPAGVGIKGDRDVRVVVSLGRRINPVPDLTGNSVRAAGIIAQQNGYKLGRITEIQKIGGEDLVIAQFPPPAAEENISDQIDVLLEIDSPKAFIMPDTAGENLNRVIKFFKENGFEVTIRYRRHRGIRRGTVVRQFPEPGYMLKEDQEIIIEVAR